MSEIHEDIGGIFDGAFKYGFTDVLYHRADTKRFSNDMSMMPLSRTIVQEKDDDGNTIYQRIYHCRVIKHSGSGEIFAFKERELMNLEEFELSRLENDEHIHEMKAEIQRTEQLVYKKFGVSGRNARVTHNGESYVVTGWGSQGKSCNLVLRHDVIGGTRIEVSDPTQIIVI
jgi:hypothetical protein